MNTLVVLIAFVSLAAMCVTYPTDFLDTDMEDSGMVESVVREVRAIAPKHMAKDLKQEGTKKYDSYVKSTGDDDSNESGYHRSTKEEGSDGYEHFDSYNKKNGNKYGFEEHSAYGKLKKKGAGGKQASHKSQQKEQQTPKETRHTYKVVEDIDEDGGAGHYVEGESNDSGADSGHYVEGGEGGGDGGDGEHYEHYEEGEGDGGSEHYEEDGGNEGDEGESGHYTSGDDGSYVGYYNTEGDGESEHYTSADNEDEGDY